MRSHIFPDGRSHSVSQYVSVDMVCDNLETIVSVARSKLFEVLEQKYRMQQQITSLHCIPIHSLLIFFFFFIWYQNFNKYWKGRANIFISLYPFVSIPFEQHKWKGKISYFRSIYDILFDSAFYNRPSVEVLGEMILFCVLIVCGHCSVVCSMTTEQYTGEHVRSKQLTTYRARRNT